MYVCPECMDDEPDLSLEAAVATGPGPAVADGRLRMHELHVDFYIACNNCSATVAIFRADDDEGLALLKGAMALLHAGMSLQPRG